MKFPLVKFKPKKTQVKGLECLNCGQPMGGDENFCSYCGQKNTVKKLNFGTFINNLFNGFFSYDSRFWTTFIPLLTKPGKVSKEYIAGKRARFVNPFQLYLNVSIVFFLVLGISNRIDKNNEIVNGIVTVNQKVDSIAQNKEKIDSLITDAKEQLIVNLPADSTNADVITGIDNVFKIVQEETNKEQKEYVYHIKSDTTKRISFIDKINDFQHYINDHPKYTHQQGLDSLGYKKTFWNKFHYQQIIKIINNVEQIKGDGGKAYLNRVFSAISISLFVFLPIFTLFLMLLYWRRKYTYMEHLVFVFNTQTVFFLLLTIFFLLNFVTDLSNAAWVFILLFLFYLYKAMRTFYQQSRSKTIFKYILLNSFYMLLGVIGLVIVGAISFVSN